MREATQSGNGGPLDGTMVLDFTPLVPGPIAGLMLAEAGAEVIKIEPLEGEAMRSPPPSWGDLSAVFALINRGKRSLALDLKNEKTRAQLRPLLSKADVVLEGFRPGVMARLGLDFETLRALNPRLVYCSVTGYGQDGPKAQRPGHDLTYIAETGLLALSPGAPENPTVPPVLIADLMGGTYPAVMAIVMALYRRERTGEGGYLDVSMTDGLFLPMFWAWAQGLSGAGWPGSDDHVFTGASPRYRCYPAADGALVAVGALEDKFWAAFCAAIALPENLRDAAHDLERVMAAVAKRIAAKPAAHWRVIFSQAQCCASVVESLQTGLRDPHFTRLTEGRQTRLGKRSIPALPMPFASLLPPEGEARAAPALGEANAEFGFSPLAARPACLGRTGFAPD